jgi:hypothetical protein
MKTFFQIDLSRMPDTYDIVHVGLGCMVLVLFMMLFVVSMLLFITLFRKLKITPDDVAVETRTSQPEPVPVTAVATPAPEPKVKIVEKVIEKSVPGPAPKPVIIREISPDAATQLLSLLQKEARFIDFVKEDISNQSDSDVGVVARIVHEGCAKVVHEHFSLSPVRKEQENSQVTLNENFDANHVSLTGNIIGKPPFTGTLVHKGWQVSEIRLPKITEGHDVNIITPAEVEL